MNSPDIHDHSAHDIPVIDLAPLRDRTAPERVAQQLAWAASEVGFIYVRNHGIASKVIRDARNAGLEFFRLPLEQKLEVETNVHHHGYLRPGATKMYDDAKVDLKESYNFGQELDENHRADPRVATNGLLGPNEWPASLPAFRPSMCAYYQAATTCAEDLLRGFAMAAGLPEDAFISKRDLPISRGSLQYYPPRPADAADDHFNLAAHTDFGVLTVLAQDDIGGLEVQAANGEWIAAIPIEGTLVVNVGDLLGRWSNGRYLSTPHRVMNTSGQERLSLVLAYDPNAETVVDSALFCRPGESPNSDPITCGDYLQWRFEKAFSYRQPGS